MLELEIAELTKMQLSLEELKIGLPEVFYDFFELEVVE